MMMVTMWEVFNDTTVTTTTTGQGADSEGDCFGQWVTPPVPNQEGQGTVRGVQKNGESARKLCRLECHLRSEALLVTVITPPHEDICLGNGPWQGGYNVNPTLWPLSVFTSQAAVLCLTYVPKVHPAPFVAGLLNKLHND